MQDGTMVDTHTHICHAEFDANRGQVLRRWRQGFRSL
jgi:hypothetical protein